MKAQLTQIILNEALTVLSPATSPNPIVPTSTFIKIHLDEKGSYLEANNGELYIKKDLFVQELEEPGTAIIQHSKLLTWVNSIPNDKIITVQDKDQSLRCRAAKSTITLALGDLQAFPASKFIAGKTTTIPSQMFKTGLTTTSSSRIGLPQKLDNETRVSPFSGTHLFINQQHIYVEALSHAYGAFSKHKYENKTLPTPINIILPGKLVALLQRILPDEGNVKLTLSTSSGTLQIQLDDAIYRTVLLAAEFPKTDNFYDITEDSVQHDIEVNANEFYVAMKNALAFTDEKKTDAVLLWADPDPETKQLVLHVQSKDNEEGNFKTIISNVTINEDPKQIFHITASIDQLSRVSNVLNQNKQIRILVRSRNSGPPALYIYGLETHPNTFYITMPIHTNEEIWKNKLTRQSEHMRKT